MSLFSDTERYWALKSEDDLKFVWPVFATAPIPVALLETFFITNAAIVPRAEGSNLRRYPFELIESSSAISTRLNALRSSKPFIEGTRPGFSDEVLFRSKDFEDLEPQRLANFVISAFPSHIDVVNGSHFIVFDERSARDGTALLVHIVDCTATDSELWGLRIPHFTAQINCLRIGLKCTAWAKLHANPTCSLDLMRLSSDEDGVFWGSLGEDITIADIKSRNKRLFATQAYILAHQDDDDSVEEDDDDMTQSEDDVIPIVNSSRIPCRSNGQSVLIR